MKKTFRMIGMACLVGVFAFAASSCKKDKTEVTSFKVNMPVVEEVSVDESKAYIDISDGNHMKWYRDDEIAFYNLAADYTHSIRNVYTLSNGANTANGYFTGDVMGELEEGWDGYYGFYPASKVVNHPIGPRNSQTFDVPAKQLIKTDIPCGVLMDPTSLVMACKGGLIMENAEMQHIFGFAGLKLKGDKVVEKIVVTDNETSLSGDITLDLPYITDGNAVLLKNRCLELADYRTDINTVWAHIGEMTDAMNYSAHGTGRTMTLECGEGIELNPDDYTRFIMTLRPGAFVGGFSVTVYYTDNTNETFGKYDPNSDEYGYNDVAVPAKYPRRFCVVPGQIMNFTLN